MSDKIFSEGIYFDRPREGAPEFVRGKLSIKVDTAVAFLTKHKNEKGYVNLDLKESKQGKLYLELNTYNAPAKSSLTDEDKAKIQALRAGEATKKEVETEVNPLDVPF